MIAELHNNLRDPQKLKVTRVLLTADDGTPVCLCVEFHGGDKPWIRCFRVGDKDFNEQLQFHGITKTVLVTSLATGPAELARR